MYTTGINEVYTVIILSNSYMFSVKFVLFSVYYSFHSLHNNSTIQLHSFLEDQCHNNLTWYQSLLRKATSLPILHCTPEAVGFPHKSCKVCIAKSGFVQRSLCGRDEP